MCEFPRGAPPGPPLNRAEMELKYVDCVKPFLPDEHIRQSLGLVWDIENLIDTKGVMQIFTFMPTTQG